MGRQVNFYAIESDYTSLLRFARDLGLLAIPQIVLTEVYELAQVRAVSPEDYRDQPKFYLIPETVPVVEAFYTEFSRDPSRSYLMPHVSPVIAIGHCRREGNKLYHNRIYINAPREGPGVSFVYAAYDKLARYIRRWPKVEQSTYAGPDTLAWVKRGHLRLMVTENRELPIISTLPPW